MLIYTITMLPLFTLMSFAGFYPASLMLDKMARRREHNAGFPERPPLNKPRLRRTIFWGWAITALFLTSIVVIVQLVAQSTGN